MLTVEGRGANRTLYANVEEVVEKTAGIDLNENIEQQFSCYRLECPNKWYTRCINQELIDKLNNKVTKNRIVAGGH